jgi:ABC-type Mn2+/Zn2+ transport system permease subunit
MLALLEIYWISLMASIFLGAGLALIGAQLAARDRAMQTLCIGQASVLGVLLGIGLSQFFHGSDFFENVGPFVIAVIFAALTFMSSESLVSKKSSSGNTHFATIFVVLLSCGYLVSALFPALENHLSQKYFGDLATMSEAAALFAACIGAALLLINFRFYGQISADSFLSAISGVPPSRGRLAFEIVVLGALCFSVQVVGFSFTIACLFIPTSILSFGQNVGLRRHLIFCASTAALGCALGFLVSLWATSLPTVPTIVVVLALVALSSNFWKRFCSTAS